MRKMTLKTLVMSLLMIFVGWQSFAQAPYTGSITAQDTVFALAKNKIMFTVPTTTAGLSTGDSIGWFLTDGTTYTPITASSAYIFESNSGITNNVLKIDGTSTTTNILTQPADNLTASTQTIIVVIYSPGGCISTDAAAYYLQVLPNLDSMVVNWTDNSALCANNSIQDTLVATKPALTGTLFTVGGVAPSVDAITWWVIDSTSAVAQVTTGITPDNSITPGTSTLAFMTPTDINEHKYHAEAAYTLPIGYTLQKSLGSTEDGHSTSNTINIQATAAPTAPVLNGTNQTVGGW